MNRDNRDLTWAQWTHSITFVKFADDPGQGQREHQYRRQEKAEYLQALANEFNLRTPHQPWLIEKKA